MTPLPDLTLTWVTLVADSVAVASPRGVTQSIANNTLAFNNEGVWSVSIGYSLTHNESNQARTIDLRLFNVTKGIGGLATVVGIGRNTDVTSGSSTVFADIPSGEVGDEWRVEVQSPDVVIDVFENSFNFAGSLVSEFRG